jgi:probable H4MPT-linked C1 transfer pathway protein
MDVLGLDVGGANLKAAHSNSTARLVPFALWKEPFRLADELRRLIVEMPGFDQIAVTMTGELCDCYQSKRHGVEAILDAVVAVVPSASLRVWRNDGRFVDVATARQTPLQVASANWLALATFAGRYEPERPALLLDIGSTTTDIVPLLYGKPTPHGRTDPERMRCHELIYTGVRRTPLCAVLGDSVAAELFATTLDAYLVLGAISEDANDCSTADGRPATRAAAHARLARMLCADLETSTEKERRELAIRAMQRQVSQIATSLELVVQTMPSTPRSLIIAGSGEFLVQQILDRQQALASPRLIALSSVLGVEASKAACAYALAGLAGEPSHADR